MLACSSNNSAQLITKPANACWIQSCCCCLLFTGGEPPALASVCVSSRVLGLTWLSAGEQQLDMQGRSLLAVLHEMTGAVNHAVVDNRGTYRCACSAADTLHTIGIAAVCESNKRLLLTTVF